MSEQPPSLTPTTSKLAIASLVSGILSLFCSLLVGIPAVIMGIVALAKIGKSNGKLTGSGLAIAGIITGIVCGIIGTSLLAGLSAPLVIRQRQKAEMVAMKADLTAFHAQVELARQTNGAPPDEAAAREALASIRVSPLAKGDWLYFPQSSLSDPDAPLLISPASRDRLVLQTDGEILTVEDGEATQKSILAAKSAPITIPATRR
jgi:Domain of unknown function (DUF4190)